MCVRSHVRQKVHHDHKIHTNWHHFHVLALGVGDIANIFDIYLNFFHVQYSK